MSRLIFATLVAALAASSAAQAAPGYPSCAQAQQIVAMRGSAVVYTGPRIYDRYVANRSFCYPTQIAKPTFAATWDNPYCPIGSICVEPEGGGRRTRW